MAKNASDSSVPFIERVEIKSDGPMKLLVVGHFDRQGSPLLLARIGEGDSELRSEQTLQASAEVVAEVLYNGHRSHWLKSNNLEGSFGNVAIQYSEDDANVATSYRGMTLSISLKSSKEIIPVQSFFTGNPVDDWKSLCQKARRDCESILMSSSCYDFASEVAGFAWDKDENLIVDPSSTSLSIRT